MLLNQLMDIGCSHGLPVTADEFKHMRRSRFRSEQFPLRSISLRSGMPLLWPSNVLLDQPKLLFQPLL